MQVFSQTTPYFLQIISIAAPAQLLGINPNFLQVNYLLLFGKSQEEMNGSIIIMEEKSDMVLV